MKIRKQQASNIFQGTLVLTAAGIIVKIIGSLNWIILSRVLGGEGMGLYQMAYPLYLLALSVSSAGIPVAISILTAERVALQDYRGARSVFRISLALLAVTGMVFSLLLYSGAGWLIEERFIRDARAYYSLVALAPAIFFVTLLSSFRGYLQGWQLMTPTAVSQIAEQVVRVLTMLFFAMLLAPRGIEYAAAGATFGAGPGALAGLIVLLFFYWRHRRRLSQASSPGAGGMETKPAGVIKRILRLSLPISAASIMLPVVSNLDLLVVPRRLEDAGYPVGQATELFGYLTGMAVPLVGLATVLTGALATSIVPAISEAHSLGQRERVYSRTAAAFRLANIVTVPAFVGVWLLAEPLVTILYHAPQAAPSVEVLAAGIVLLGVHQVSTGVLQGMGRTMIPVVNMAISAVAKVGLNWTLTVVPGLGIAGAAWATVADIGIAALLNMRYVRRHTGFILDYRSLGKSIAAAAVMGGIVHLVFRAVVALTKSNNLAVLSAIVIGVTVYGTGMLLIGGIGAADVRLVPLVGPRLARLLQAVGLLAEETPK
ncbi:MAG TPA: polysaccharide biosynthesis protein [Selenomonadales bacterium]|nr:polysaccharide biosynthesis protein [Selenomonadales bacterium]